MRVRIANVLPKDKQKVIGKIGDVIEDTIEVGSRMIITFADGYYLITSVVNNIEYEYGRAIISTQNSVYYLDPID